MRAIRRSERFEDMVRQLAEANHPDAGRPIFPTMRELMCFAAILGFENERKKPLEDSTKEIDGRTFESHDKALDLIYLLALADAKNAEVLRDESEDSAIAIFEQYAEGGFDILLGWLREKPEDPFGDKAILAALDAHGFLQQPRNVDDAAPDVSF